MGLFADHIVEDSKQVKAQRQKKHTKETHNDRGDTRQLQKKHKGTTERYRVLTKRYKATTETQGEYKESHSDNKVNTQRHKATTK